MMKTEKVIEVVSLKQIVRETEYSQRILKSPDDVSEIAQNIIGDDDREVFLVIGVNTKMKINFIHRCHIGSVNSSIVHPREVFKSAILNNCSSIFVAHNHPSGNTTPSKEDIAVTQRLVESGQLLGIDVVDHIIVSHSNRREPGYYSFKEMGIL